MLQAVDADRIRTLRLLEMPLPEIRAILAGGPDKTRALLEAHRDRLVEQAARQRYAITLLEAMLHDGFDVQPLGQDDLTPWLARLSAQAEKEQTALMVTLASTSGWDSSARRIIQGQPEGKPGSAFLHRLVQVYLFDLETRDLVYNVQDERASRYAELFMQLSNEEISAEAARQIEHEMLLQDSLSLNDAALSLPYTRDQLWMAFRRLAATGRFRLEEFPDQLFLKY